ncbi:MAG: DUF3014 domain-containing protein [Pseudomonadota bacterium]
MSKDSFDATTGKRKVQTDPEDRLSHAETETRGGLPKLPLIAVALLILIGVLWFGLQEEEAAPEIVVETPAQVATPVEPVRPEPPPAPDIPAQSEPEPVLEPELAEPELEPVAEEPPLTLAESDPEVRAQLQSADATDLYQRALAEENLLERAAALVSGAQRGYLVDQALPLPAPDGRFSVTLIDDSVVAAPASYERYEPYVDLVESVDTGSLVRVFHSFRPLLEEAYEALGYNPEDFDNALIAALDLVLATPVLTEPQALERDVTTYHYVDETLENLPALQKQLMRMGPDNLERLQAVASQLREALLAPP